VQLTVGKLCHHINGVLEDGNICISPLAKFNCVINIDETVGIIIREETTTEILIIG